MLAVVLAQASMAAEVRERRQTVQQCRAKFTESAAAWRPVTTNCMGSTECSSDCMSALNTFKDSMGCCLTSISGDDDIWSTFFDRCSSNISLPGRCGSTSSTSGVFASFSVVTFISAFSYIMN